jgi:hypothetical protein
MHVSTSRGIKNVSKVSCHISAGIQLIFHSLSATDREDFISLSSFISNQQQKIFRALSDEESFLMSFGHLLFEMCAEQCGGIDPDDFYQKCRINSYEVGDASNSLRSMMLDIRSSLKFIHDNYHYLGYDTPMGDLSLSLLERINAYFWQGISITQIRGSRVIEKEDGHRWKLTRLKDPKEKPFSCPIAIPVVGYNSILPSLQSVIASEQIVSGYKWDATPDYIEEEVIIDSKDYIHINGGDLFLNPKLQQDSSSTSDDSSESCLSSNDGSSSASSSATSSASNDDKLNMMCDWVTKRVIRPLQLPKLLFLQLLRFNYEGVRVQKINTGMNIPYMLDLTGLIETELCCIECYKYQLSGATIYKSEKRFADEHEDDIGHYFSFMKEEEEDKHKTYKGDIWKKIDDEKVSSFLVTNDESVETDMKVVQERVFVGVLGGKTKKKDTFATILLYKSKCRCVL